MKNRTYIAIDLKSFYASVECIERKLDPLTTNLVVADVSRTEKTICLAVSPSLKTYGISGRARLFEVIQKVREVNVQRRQNAPRHTFFGASFNDIELKSSPELALDYIAAPPRMAHYIEYSTRIYNIYLKYVAPEDMHVYSIDEVFMDVTDYLKSYKMSVRELATKMIQDVRKTTGITATAGIGTNLYLCKIAMDIQAKHIPVDRNGVLIAELDEVGYRHLMWSHRPLTDFWRVGRGHAKRLEEQGLFTMGDIAKCSLGKPSDYYNEDLLYKMFGINAELLIDHAWGWEPCTIADVKAYKPSTNSIGSGQVLQCACSCDKARLVVREMTDLLALDLVDRSLVTDQLVLTVGYDIENLSDQNRKQLYRGPVTTDHYGRSVPKSAHGTINLGKPTASTKRMLDSITELFEEIVDRNLLVRRINISANHVVDESTMQKTDCFEQLSLFTDYAAAQAEKEEKEAELAKEKKVQKAMLEIKRKYGKNAILKGMNLEEGATTVLRNRQIGGHKA
ncbi:DNA polymerase V [Kineothrix alysoides]|uniref:DNA polymerase V n=1 Tax=Kineothrix alysoides TaxID=1469948 RepID=A0A4R1QYH6_9FIRM|nr:DNA methylase [Kineothrix alysoides]TCL57620.1 DNA polymerase V [Kineothrix alysoides]